MTSFRDRLIATLRAARPVLEVDGVLVAGSEVPNLLERGAASTLVVSQDVDLAVPIAAHRHVRARLDQLVGFSPMPSERSVWVPDDDTCIEINFIGFDPDEVDPRSVHVLEDDVLPLMVFGPLSFLRPGTPIDLGDGFGVPVPRNAGLLLEKLVTDRSGTKGDRDLLVALGLLLVANEPDVDELMKLHSKLPHDLRETVRSNLTLLSLLDASPQMPDPTRERARIAALLLRLESAS